MAQDTCRNCGYSANREGACPICGSDSWIHDETFIDFDDVGQGDVVDQDELDEILDNLN